MNRWLLLRTGGDGELDRRQEPHQPHDQPAPADHPAHPQQDAQDGHRPLESHPVMESSSGPPGADQLASLTEEKQHAADTKCAFML